jgi:Undecaprenyl-phosphate galactose phosphotransferase WbaP
MSRTATQPVHVTAVSAAQAIPALVEFPRLALPGARRVKRTLDIAFAIVLAIVALPVSLLIAAAILIESGRPVFFRHRRIGRGGRSFSLLKFRTMAQNSDEILAEYLAGNPEAAHEWDRNRKLRYDPRVTRIGRLLRRTSLDELPQIFNIFRGEMSIAGPRPIVEAEIAKYGNTYPLYSLAKPGLTGLWQVSGRNDTTYRRRVELDAAYVRNWTPALDFKLLFKTVGVVVKGKGAY